MMNLPTPTLLLHTTNLTQILSTLFQNNMTWLTRMQILK